MWSSSYDPIDKVTKTVFVLIVCSLEDLFSLSVTLNQIFDFVFFPGKLGLNHICIPLRGLTY